MDNLYFSNFTRELHKDNQIIVGNIITDGRWLKLPESVFKYIKDAICKFNSIDSILSESNEAEVKVYTDIVNKLYDIKVLLHNPPLGYLNLTQRK